MNSAWVGAISALGGVLVGAFAEAWRAAKAFKREKGWSLRDERREKLERLYEALDEASESYGRSLGEAILNLSNESASRLGEPDVRVPWSRMRMLVHFYFPEFIPLLPDVERLGPVVGQTIGFAIIETARDKETVARHMTALNGAIGAFWNATSAMKRALVIESQSIAAEREKATT